MAYAGSVYPVLAGFYRICAGYLVEYSRKNKNNASLFLKGIFTEPLGWKSFYIFRISTSETKIWVLGDCNLLIGIS